MSVLLQSVQLQTSHIFWLRCDLFYQVGMKLIRKLHFIFHCCSINKIQIYPSGSCLMFLMIICLKQSVPKPLPSVNKQQIEEGISKLNRIIGHSCVDV